MASSLRRRHRADDPVDQPVDHVRGVSGDTARVQRYQRRASLSWILNGYTIVAAATLVLGGVLADRTGRKRALLVGSALSLVAVLVCGAAPDATTLLIGRVVLALAASLLIPASTSLVLLAFPPTKSARAFGVLSSFGGVSAAAGPSLGALIIAIGGWRWAFFANIPLAVITLVRRPQSAHRIARRERARSPI